MDTMLTKAVLLLVIALTGSRSNSHAAAADGSMRRRRLVTPHGARQLKAASVVASALYLVDC